MLDTPAGISVEIRDSRYRYAMKSTSLLLDSAAIGIGAAGGKIVLLYLFL